MKKARDAYISALTFLDLDNATDVAARCCKNLGAAMGKLNKPDEAHAFYTRALELDPNLSEAHFALALWYNRKNADLDRALEHLDAIVWSADSAGTSPSVQGWRAEILFKQGESKEAFRDIRSLLGDGERQAWIWSWCARLVAIYGRTSLDATQDSIKFWDTYLRRSTNDLIAQQERLLCIWRVHADGGQAEWDFDQFKKTVADVVARGAQESSVLVGSSRSLAQDEKDWSEAESCYRKAFELSPEEYGYCLGTALNFLGRYEEALPIVLPQANEHQPDAMSWSQLAVAMEGTGDVEGCINAYKRCLQLDENYDLAWFNLGGVYWNCQSKAEAMATWREAIRRFPTHQLSAKLQRDFPILVIPKP